MPSNPTAIARWIAFILVCTALYLTFSIERSALHRDDWNVTLNISPLNLGLLILAALVMWAGTLMSKRQSRRGATGQP